MILTQYIIFCLLLIVLDNMQAVSGNENKKTNFTEIVGAHGYPIEVHEIETEDGYLLDIYRVPFSRNSTIAKPNNHPVILSHGLMGSAENFVIGGPSKALVYVLADNGFDVWLLNARGNWHSRKHRTLDPDKDQNKFWKFTWHEIGYYDIPATIDYILQKTRKQKLHYVGHSQGSTSFFAMLSEKPEYSDKINVMIGMAPSAILGNIKQPVIRMIAPMSQYLKVFAEAVGIYELIPQNLLSNEIVRLIGKNLCNGQSSITNLCTNMLVAMAGFTEEQLDPDTVPLIVSIGPAGASVYQALHYAQLVATGKFIKYDWGPNENQIRYNSSTPPEYNLNNVACPVSLIYGESDVIVTKEDVAILANLLPNVVDIYKIPYEKWSHMDFIWAKGVDKFMNKHLIRMLRRYNK